MGEYTVKIGTEDAMKAGEYIDFMVDTCINMPNMCTVRLHDDDLTRTDKLKIGDAIEIKAEAEFLFKGEITALEPHFANGKITLVIRGYDKSHRLFLNKRTRVFAKQTVKAIISDVATGLTLKMTSAYSSIQYPYLIQNNQTDMEFLQELAWRLGLNMYISAEGDLELKESKGAAPVVKVNPKSELIDFQIRLTAAQQIESVTVWGWDSDEKKGFKVEAAAEKAAHQAKVTDAGGAVAKSPLGGAAVGVVEYPVSAQGKEAEALAKALVKRRNNDFLQAEATITVKEGDAKTYAKVRAGATIEVEGAGKTFSGEYYVASAKHVDDGGEYRLYLELHGGEPNTVHDILQGRNGNELARKVMPGPIPALVTDLTDPDKLGRVKVKFHWVTDKGADVASNWARLVSPMAGKERGIFYVPEVNDEVLVAFEQGDPNRPYILGALWNKKDVPPRVNTAVKDGHVNELVIRSRSGHFIILDDTKDAEGIVIRDKTLKNEIIINSKENSLSITIAGNITIEAKDAISIKSESKDITLEAQNIKMTAKQNFSVDATQSCEIKAKQSCSVQGTAGVEVKSTATVMVQGKMVDVNNGALQVI